MTLEEARNTVILAGKKLVESGLIARTWGNVSCRISNSHFVITPSGRDYLSLKPEEIVEVSISDCSYSGSIKPSSEKGIHAEVYKLYPEVNFVIHTHQDYASAVSVLDKDSIHASAAFPSLGGEVVCAAYGLPGTKKLRRNVASALAKAKGKAVIMKNHGALCFGRDYHETFEVAQELENASQEFISHHCLKVCGKPDMTLMQIGEFALSKLTGKPIMESSFSSPPPLESERTEMGFRLRVGNQSFDIAWNQQLDNTSFTADILSSIKVHHEIYRSHRNINSIIHANTPGIQSVSHAGLNPRPLLDDFAQIAGTSIKTIEENAAKISSALKKASAVFIKNKGALCCGTNKGDATAVGMVMEKNCIALISAALFGNIKYINRLECMLMRFVYLKKYSKQAAA